METMQLSLPSSEMTLVDSTYRKVAARFIPILLLAYIVAYLDRVNVGFAKLEMLTDLNFSDAAYAFGASIFFWGYVLFEVPSNMILRKVGARRWIARIMLSWGLVAIATMYTAQLASFFNTENTTMFYILRFLLGVCEAGFYPGVILFVNQWFPSNRQSKILSGFLIALPISLAIGAPLSGWLMESMHGVMGLNGWQWMLGIEGIPAIILAVVVFYRLDDNIKAATWLNDQEKALLSKNVEAENKEKTYLFRQALKDYRVWLLVGIVFTYNTGFYGLSFWLPSIIKATGIQSPLTIGILFSIPFIAATIAMILNAQHSAKTDERRWHAAVPALLGAVGLILSAAFANNIAISIFFLCVAASGILALMPVFWTYPGRLLYGPAAAAGIAMINALGSLSGISGSMITSVVKDVTGNINHGTYVLGASLFVTMVLILLIPKSTFTRTN